VTASDKLLVFLTRRDVAATNNESERALRPSVIFRKVTNGFRSYGVRFQRDVDDSAIRRNLEPAAKFNFLFNLIRLAKA
jgi:Transposase IS66 family